MKILTRALHLAELNKMAEHIFGNLVKAVVDVEKGVIAVDAELHADLEALLLENGSKQQNLWGINLYPELSGDDFIEFDSMINMRPSQGNTTRGIEDKSIRDKIAGIVAEWIKR